MRGLSLGTDCVASMNGDVLSRCKRRCAPRSTGHVDHGHDGRLGTPGALRVWNITSRSNREVRERERPQEVRFAFPCAMAEATPSDVADSVTKQTYEETKALAEARAAKLATAERAAYEARELRSRAAGDAEGQGDFHRVFDAETKSHLTAWPTGARATSWQPGHADAARYRHPRVRVKLQRARGTPVQSTASSSRKSPRRTSPSRKALASKEARIGGHGRQEIQQNSERLQLQLEKAGPQGKVRLLQGHVAQADAKDEGVVATTECVKISSRARVRSVHGALRLGRARRPRRHAERLVASLLGAPTAPSSDSLGAPPM